MYNLAAPDELLYLIHFDTVRYTDDHAIFLHVFFGHTLFDTAPGFWSLSFQKIEEKKKGENEKKEK